MPASLFGCLHLHPGRVCASPEPLGCGRGQAVRISKASVDSKYRHCIGMSSVRSGSSSVLASDPSGWCQLKSLWGHYGPVDFMPDRLLWCYAGVCSKMRCTNISGKALFLLFWALFPLSWPLCFLTRVVRSSGCFSFNSLLGVSSFSFISMTKILDK